MRKDELLHLHQLLACVRQEVQRRDDTPAVPAQNYDAVSVSPMAAYEPKSQHQEAVQALAADLAAALDADDDHDAPVRRRAST